MARFLSLHCEKAPSGRCLFLAKAIFDVALLPSRDSVLLAEDLFNMKYSPEAPFKLPIKTEADLSALKQICLEFGVVLVEYFD